MKIRHFYLVHIQYLGTRFHGWMVQPGVKTVEGMIRKTTKYILGETPFKLLGTSRTDAMVSANHSAFELFTETALPTDALLCDFNRNLPGDIRVTKIEEVDASFNIMQSPKVKEYLYLFSFGEKPHPFAASLLTGFPGDLDIPLMQEGAKLFVGCHNFRQYTARPKPNSTFEREVTVSAITPNTLYEANFFPEETFAFHIHGKGFLRYQVRLIMWQLVRLGRHEITFDDIRVSLEGGEADPIPGIAPASGLILNRIRFE